MITLKQTKDYLSIGNNSDDEFLKDLYTYALSQIEGYCGRTFEERSIIRELYQGNNRAYLKISTPILEIIQLEIDNKVIEPEDYTIKHNMLFYPNLFPAKYGYINGKLSTYNRKYNIAVSYKAGYKFPKWEDIVNSGDVPYELQYVCLELIKRMYINSGVCAQVQTHTVSTGGESVANQYFKQDIKEIMTPDMKGILKRYK